MPGVAPALLLALAALTWSVAHGGWPTGLDRAVEDWLPRPDAEGWAEPLRVLAYGVTLIGTPTLDVAAVLLAAALWWRRTARARPSIVVIRVALLSISVWVGKAVLHRAGPPGARRPHLLGYFPSGHTATALLCAGTLAGVLSVHRPEWRRRAWAAAIAWTLAVAASLVYHRYHWLSDVVAGALVAALVLRLVPIERPTPRLREPGSPPRPR